MSFCARSSRARDRLQRRTWSLLIENDQTRVLKTGEERLAELIQRHAARDAEIAALGRKTEELAAAKAVADANLSKGAVVKPASWLL